MHTAINRHNRLLALSIILIVGLSSCVKTPVSGRASGNGSVTEPTKAQKMLSTVTLKAGSVSVLTEVARTEEEKMRGLMFRTSLDDGKAMIFVYYQDEKLSFWMKNTLVPLSIGYLSADGTIREILDMQPLSLAPVPSSHYVRYALEVPQGWFSRVGLTVGDKFSLPPGFPDK